MTYNCPLKPPHVNSDGSVMAHKTRKECMQMGFKNRGGGQVNTPPETASPLRAESADAAPAAAVGVDSSNAPQAQTPPPKAKKGKFTIFKQNTDSPPEGSPEHKEQQETPRWTRDLSEDVTIRFWTTIMSLGKGAVELIDKTIHAKHPYDTKQLEFTTSEEQMIGDVMPGITSRLLMKLGIKSVEGAERFVNGMVILRIFGRIFVTLGVHYYQEAKEKGAENRKKKETDAAAQKGKEEAAPAIPSPEAPRVPRLSPAQMELMNKAMVAEMVPAGAK